MACYVLTAIFVVMTTVCVLEGSRCHLDRSRHFLDCTHVGLQSVPTGSISGDIWRIDLSFNNISEIGNYAFSEASDLQTLDLSNNELKSVLPDAFQGLGNLISLNLSRNRLYDTAKVFIHQLFKPLVSLKLIRIGICATRNDWKDIERSLTALKNLTSLYVSFPHKFKFGNGFRELKNLAKISTSKEDTIQRWASRGCLLRKLLNTTFEALRDVAVKELQITQCSLTKIETGAFDPLKSLEILDLSDNYILRIGTILDSLYGLQSNNMTKINMSFVDSIRAEQDYIKLREGSFKYMSKICVRSVDLSRNYVYFTYENPLQFRLDCLENLNMSYHAIKVWPTTLMMYLSNAIKLEYLDLSRDPAKSYHSKGPVKNSTHLSMFPLIFFPIPPNLLWLSVSGFQNADISNSDLSFSRAPRLWYVGAAHIDLYICLLHPLGWDIKNLTYLDVSGAICEDIRPYCFAEFDKLITLNLSNCRNKNGKLGLHPLQFLFQPDLEEIDLSYTDLRSLHPDLFKKNQKLRIVNLSNNKLTRLPRTLSHLTKLNKLDLTFNDISYFTPDEVTQLDTRMLRDDGGHPFQLLLSGNPLQCSCDTVLFLQWLFQRKGNLDNVDEYKCRLPNGTRVSLLHFQEQLSDFAVKCVSYTYLTISVVGILTLLFAVFLFVVVYRYRLNLRYWLYTKLMPPENMFVDHEYNYDVFVAYTSDDYEWVIRQLRPKLELVDDPVRLCVHDRDFIPGKLIHENIVDKMRESRKILLIISTGFLRSQYGPLEIEYAGMKCLEEGRDDTILCVLMEDIPVRQMPRALRNLWHKITFLKWSDDPEEQAIFWRNLKAVVSRTEQ